MWKAPSLYTRAVFSTSFVSGPSLLRKITADPHILAHLNTVSGGILELKICISELILDSLNLRHPRSVRYNKMVQDSTVET